MNKRALLGVRKREPIKHTKKKKTCSRMDVSEAEITEYDTVSLRTSEDL